MATNYRVDCYSASGVQLPSLPVIEGEYTLTERDVGVLHLVLPPSVPIANLQKDGRLQVHRAIDGGSFYLEGDATWLIRRRLQSLRNRERIVEVWALHVTTVLARRIVAYAAGTTQTSKSDLADDMIKEIVRENLTAPIDTTRTMSGISVAADLGQGPTVERSFSRRNILEVLRDICDDSAAQGTYLGFEVRTIGTALTALTYINQRGVDRRFGTANYLPLSVTSGAIAESSLDEDWSEEKTFIYALGGGEEELRTVGSAQNTVAEGASAFGRIEGSYQASQETDTSYLDSMAAGELYAQRGRVRYEATYQDSPKIVYGRDFRWGDLLTINDYGQQFDVRVDPVSVKWGRSGEQLDIKFMYDNIGLAV